jgi:hypothetical protein
MHCDLFSGCDPTRAINRGLRHNYDKPLKQLLNS